MAKSDFGTIIGLGIAGIAGWWLYNNWASIFGAVTVAPATTTPAGGIVAAGTPPAVASVPVQTVTTTPVTTAAPVAGVTPTTLQQQIQAMAGAGVNMLNFDQWNYYYNQILATRGQPPLTPAVFGTLLTSQGFTEPSPAVPLTTFMAALASQGLSGIRSNRGHFRRVNYVNMRGRSSNGMYVPSGNTSPVSGGF